MQTMRKRKKRKMRLQRLLCVDSFRVSASGVSAAEIDVSCVDYRVMSVSEQRRVESSRRCVRGARNERGRGEGSKGEGEAESESTNNSRSSSLNQTHVSFVILDVCARYECSAVSSSSDEVESTSSLSSPLPLFPSPLLLSPSPLHPTTPDPLTHALLAVRSNPSDVSESRCDDECASGGVKGEWRGRGRGEKRKRKRKRRERSRRERRVVVTTHSHRQHISASAALCAKK